MEQIFINYCILTTAITALITSLLSLIPFKWVQKISKPIATTLTLLAPIVFIGLACWLVYKCIKYIYLKQTTIKSTFLTHNQKVQMLENLYNSQDAIHA